MVVLPNPFNTQLRILNGNLRGLYTLLWCYYGRVMEEVASGVLEEGETCLDTASFPTGEYRLRLTSEDGVTAVVRVRRVKK